MENSENRSGTLNKSKVLTIFLLISTFICLGFAYYASYKYMTLALDVAEPNEDAKHVALVMANATILASAILFLSKPYLSNKWVTLLAGTALIYEIITMGSNQYICYKQSALSETKNQQLLKLSERDEKSLDKQADVLRKNGTFNSLSELNNERNAGINQIDSANKSSLDALKSRAEQKDLINNKKITFASELPEGIIVLKCVLRSIILPGTIAFCFWLIGILLSYLVPENKKQQNPIKENESNLNYA